MRRLFVLFALTALATVATAHEPDRLFSGIDSDDCSRRGFRIDGRRAYVAEESFDAPSLRTISLRNAPLTVTGGNSSGYTVTVCKGAALAEDLDDIKVSVVNGELTTAGPSHGDWMVTYKITAPRGATLDIETRNGPIAIRDADGTFQVRAQNGPLALDDVRGTVDAETVNGPIAIKGGSGTMKVKASNGPISVSLEGASWEGGSLEASTNNGPLSVKVPRSYGSGVLVEASGRGPVSCRAEACESISLRDWSDDPPRRIELGRGPQNVRLSTVNGPVTVKDAD